MLVKTFQFNDQDLIVHEDIYGELWFRGTNVCSILGFSNPTMAMKTHVGDYLQELSIGEGRPAYYIAEKGLYILTFRAKNPAALEFQLWAADVIKSVRKTGKYIAKAEDQQHFAPFGMEIQKLDSLIDLAKAKGLEPSKVIDLHKQLTGQSDQPQEIMTSPNGGGKKPRDYQAGLRRTLNLARSRGMVTAREIQQMKYFNDKGEIVRGFRELQAQGLGRIEISHNGTSIRFHPAPVPVVKG